jgi:hypothetical protein
LVTFHHKNAVGKAGERLVETFVEEELQFIYRRQDSPDIGIDGEIEIQDENRVPTGGFVKVQVKTASESLQRARFRVSLDEEHLDYFALLTVPPILAVVSLADKEIWWKPILHKDNYKGPRGGHSVSFNSRIDQMTRSSAELLRMIGERSNAMIAKYLIEEIDEQLTEIDEEEEQGNYDIVAVEGWAETIKRIERAMKDAECLLRYERRHSSGIAAIAESFDDAERRIKKRKDYFDTWGVADLLTYDLRGTTAVAVHP